MAEILSRWLDSMRATSQGGLQRTTWQPAADVYRTERGWLVKFDLAGVRRNDVQLAIHGSDLTLTGCRRDELIEEGILHYRMEIAYSCFARTIEMPCDLARAEILTEMRDGMLLIRITPDAG